jgi:Phage tail sheath protein subtilisin-like domain/Phage tail sheath C-terminal domain
MAFQVSPGVNVSEIDLTTVVPAVATSTGAIAGVFKWGPVGVRTLVSSEIELVSKFGKPTNHNPETFFTAANFLAYGNSLYVSRAASATDFANGVISAIANTGSVVNAQVYTVKNDDVYDQVTFGDTDVLYVARYPGDLGNSLKISVCDSVNAYSKSIDIQNADANLESASITATVGSNSIVFAVANSATGTLAEANTRMGNVLSELQVNDVVVVGNSSIGKQYVKITSLPAAMGTNSQFANTTHRYFTASVDNAYQLSTNYSSNTFTKSWEYFNVVDSAPGISDYQASQGNTSAVDEIHVVVVDEDGKFSGVPGTVLEVYKGLSRATDAKTTDGSTNYYKTVINDTSKYVWWANHRATAPGNTALNIASVNTAPLYLSFNQGQDGDGEGDVSLGTILAGYDLFASAEDVDISLLMVGKSRGGTNGEQIANYLVDNIAETRKDCIVLASPDKADVVNNSAQDEAQDTVDFRNSCRSSSYLVIDSGYKYQYDKYNDLFRWVPLNGDIAGLCVRTDSTRDPWFSPAGFNRGQIKNVVKLAYNPDKADRDLLYKNGVNPVATFPGQGTVLFGDKTALAKPSAFDRINVRRLFIVLEKAIATAAKFSLFEFNDEFTRAQFVALVEPFLRDVQGRRGIYDYRVVCDTSNNTGEVVDRNEFVGDIYVKPAKSINFIQLNFVAVRTGVAFDEVVGKF